MRLQTCTMPKRKPIWLNCAHTSRRCQEAIKMWYVHENAPVSFQLGLVFHTDLLNPDHPQSWLGSRRCLSEAGRLNGCFRRHLPTFEQRVSTAVFSSAALSEVDRSKLACVIHSIPPDLKGQDLDNLGKQARKIAGDIFMTDLSQSYYENFAPKWAEFVGAMAA